VEFVPYHPDRAYWHFLRGSRFEAQGQDRQAVAELEMAIHLNANQHEALSRLGILRFKSGSAVSARQLWQRSLEIQPRQAQILNNLAWVLAEDPVSGPNEWQTALAHAELAVEITRRTEPGYLDTLAVVLERTGKREQAKAVLREAMHVAQQMDDAALVEELKNRLASWQEP
jgi:Flp pilus assembly protein TadD